MQSTETNRKARNRSESAAVPAAPFSDLPQDLRQAVSDGIIKPQEWAPSIVREGFIVADPGHRIAILRAVHNLTQTELAVKAGVRQADVSVAEANIGKSKIEILEKLTAVLGVSVQDILFNTNSAKASASKPQNSSHR